MRACRMTNAVTRAREIAPRPSVFAEPQPCSLTPMIEYTPSISPTVHSTAPGMSAPAARPRPGLAATRRSASIAVAIPIGTLMKKIQCQEMASVSAPPASRPIDPPAEATKP